MATKNAVFSTFSVESLLSTERSVGKIPNLGQENEQDPKSTKKDSNLAQNFCAGILLFL